MHLVDVHVILSASDLTGFLECTHLTQQEMAATRGEIERPERSDPELELITRLGTEHEERQLARYRDEGKSVVAMPSPTASRDSYLEAHGRTLEAMRTGADVIYQATLFDGRWLGYADFLEKADRPSRLGNHSYEVVDTKLARSAKAAALLQTCLYSELLAGLQGAYPESMYLVLGDGSRPRLRVSDYRAYLHHAKARLEAVAGAGPIPTYPEPVEHCGVCRWSKVCEKRGRDDDNLAMVASLQRSQARKLVSVGVTTVASLASSPAGLSATGIGGPTLNRRRWRARPPGEGGGQGHPPRDVLPAESPPPRRPLPSPP